MLLLSLSPESNEWIEVHPDFEFTITSSLMVPSGYCYRCVCVAKINWSLYLCAALNSAIKLLSLYGSIPVSISSISDKALPAKNWILSLIESNFNFHFLFELKVRFLQAHQQ